MGQENWEGRPGIVHDDKVIKGFFGPYRFLSNYHPVQITYEGLTYKSTEAAYQAAKTFDTEVRKVFTKVGPGTSKVMGNTVPLRADWDNVKYDIMLELTRKKYGTDAELREALLDTGEKSLEEANWWGDKYWGTVEGEGQNWLGLILMQVRNEIKDLK
jgi:ribA/ribD-fused uncharacterized protein